jgi:hypothetical protein
MARRASAAIVLSASTARRSSSAASSSASLVYTGTVTAAFLSSALTLSESLTDRTDIDVKFLDTPAGTTRSAGSVPAGAPGSLVGSVFGRPPGMNTFDIIQIVGALLNMGAFALLHFEIAPSSALRYLIPNWLGSVLLVASAYVDRQWGFLMLEGAWVIVTGYAIALKATGRKPRATTH